MSEPKVTVWRCAKEEAEGSPVHWTYTFAAFAVEGGDATGVGNRTVQTAEGGEYKIGEFYTDELTHLPGWNPK